MKDAMPEAPPLNRPWLVAVWPGMGNVAASAGYYLMSKLGMHQLCEFPARDLFEVEFVDVKGGLIRGGRLPRSRFFVWNDPDKERDLVVFLGEAQPPTGKNAFCRRLIEYAEEIGVEKVFTFAAMATGMHPTDDARVFGAATDSEVLQHLKAIEDIEILEEGRIGGLNGVILGAAAEAGIPGACLLGEMPHVFAQIPFPKASLRVLEVFSRMAGIAPDLSELQSESLIVENRLDELLSDVLEQLRQGGQPGETEMFASPEPETDEREERERRQEAAARRENLLAIEKLFDEAQRDRSKAYELKRELDRHGLFAEFEDRFLDLFKNSADEAE